MIQATIGRIMMDPMKSSLTNQAIDGIKSSQTIYIPRLRDCLHDLV